VVGASPGAEGGDVKNDPLGERMKAEPHFTADAGGFLAQRIPQRAQLAEVAA
jgi:hypothetical protein